MKDVRLLKQLISDELLINSESTLENICESAYKKFKLNDTEFI